MTTVVVASERRRERFGDLPVGFKILIAVALALVIAIAVGITGVRTLSQSSITGVADAAQLTSEGAVQSQAATAELARMSTELKPLVDTFRY